MKVFMRSLRYKTKRL